MERREGGLLVHEALTSNCEGGTVRGKKEMSALSFFPLIVCRSAGSWSDGWCGVSGL